VLCCVFCVVGLGWVGFTWIGLGWVGLGWVGLGWVGLGFDKFCLVIFTKFLMEKLGLVRSGIKFNALTKVIK
jgi:hypothetical protein